MKTIKFRAWDRKVEEFYYFYLLSDAYKIVDNKCEVTQFIGISDKNGVEIYEGDIVKWDDTDDTGYISYMEETTEYIVDTWKKGKKESKGYSLSSLGEVEIIGNIYENKK